MATLVKHEWHQTDVQYALELDEALLAEIYPKMGEKELANLLAQIENGDINIEDIVNDANENDVEIEWEHQYDDRWTDRKGGYDVTYELGDEDSWHSEPEPPPHTHKCTKCKWTGQSYDADWVWPEDDDTGKLEAKKLCPYCESDTELTEAGIKDKQEFDERNVRWAQEGGGGCDDECCDCGHGVDTGWDDGDGVDMDEVDEAMVEHAPSEPSEQIGADTKEPQAKWPFENDSDDEGMDSEHDNWRGQWSQFNVYHNKK